MLRRRRSPSGLASALLLATGCSDLASAMSPKAELEPYANYTGRLRVNGSAHFTCHSETADFAWELSGADTRCSRLASGMASRACRFELREGTSCSEELGGPLWGISEDEDIPADAWREDPWTATRYNVSADGRSAGSIERLRLGLTQKDMFEHVLTVTDADGVTVACGSVTSTCFRLLGICFYQWARMATGVCTVLAVLDSAWLIRKHFRHNKNPSLRKYTVRILLMVPIYSLQAFIALWFQVTAVQAELMRFFRELYEAIVIFSFLQFIIVCVGGSESVVRRIDGDPCAADPGAGASGGAANGEEEADGRPDGQGDDDDSSGEEDGAEHAKVAREDRLKHIPPWSFICPPWRSARQMLQWCVMGTLSYVVVGLFVPVMMLIATLFYHGTPIFHDMLQLGKFLFMGSSMFAINSLFELAHIFLPDLKDLSPVAKFVSVKVVVFFTFWQGLVLGFLVYRGAFRGFIDAAHKWTTQDQISQAVQHGLICLEMFGASIAHHFAFPPSDYKIVRRMRIERSLSLHDEDPRHSKNPFLKRVQVVDFRDIIQIARYGLAPTRFTAPAEGAGGSSEGDSEMSEASDASSEEEVRALEERS